MSTMSRQKQIVLRPSASQVIRRQTLLEVSDYAPQAGLAVRLAEVAGGTTAEVAAVTCCCPFGVVDLLLLATYKVPTGLYRKALRQKRRRRLIKMGLLPPPNCSCEDKDLQILPFAPPDNETDGLELAKEDAGSLDFDNEMFEQFSGGGFWRSASAKM